MIKRVGPFDNPDLVSRILRMCPRTWQAQYKLTKDTVAQSVRKLLEVLEKIKKVFPTDRQQPGKKGKANPSDSTKGKMVSFKDPIPTKRCQDAKHCILCKKHGGAHATHNTSNCRKYEKDGSHKKVFGRGQCKSTAPNKKTANANAQLPAKIAKLKKVSKQFEKSSKKHKHDYDSNSNDSYSS